MAMQWRAEAVGASPGAGACVRRSRGSATPDADEHQVGWFEHPRLGGATGRRADGGRHTAGGGHRTAGNQLALERPFQSGSVCLIELRPVSQDAPSPAAAAARRNAAVSSANSRAK